MSNELETCLAALFINKGKDVLTAKEFTMYASLDLRWMQVRDANALMNVLIEKKLMSKNGDYLRPLINISEVSVPVAYRPSADLIKALNNNTSKQPAATKKDAAPDLLPKLIQEALASGMEKGAFVSECNKISKRMDVDMAVAAIMILKERGVDATPFIEEARSSVLSR
ncbi:MAG: DUF2240 family protein [Methanomassiliicoccaceae archaeon]|nr:DUF2240 family protein [Methanomassiliicoccaceae archaeon]